MRLSRQERAIIEIRSGTGVGRLAADIDFDEMHSLGNNAAIAGPIGAAVLDGMLQEKQSTRLYAFVGIVDVFWFSLKWRIRLPVLASGRKTDQRTSI